MIPTALANYRKIRLQFFGERVVYTRSYKTTDKIADDAADRHRTIDVIAELPRDPPSITNKLGFAPVRPPVSTLARRNHSRTVINLAHVGNATPPQHPKAASDRLVGDSYPPHLMARKTPLVQSSSFTSPNAQSPIPWGYFCRRRRFDQQRLINIYGVSYG